MRPDPFRPLPFDPFLLSAFQAGHNVDEIYDAAKMELKILQDGCFVAGTLVQIASVAQPVLQVAGEFASDWWNSIEVHDSLALPIEEVPLGARIATKNPNRSDIDDSLPEPDSTWKQVRMQFQRKNGSRVDIELLRPVEWIERHRLAVGEPIFMSNAEIEVRGTGRVLAIEDSPPIADGEGSVVIARIKTHHAGKLVEGALKVSGTYDCHSDRKRFLTPLFLPDVNERQDIERDQPLGSPDRF